MPPKRRKTKQYPMKLRNAVGSTIGDFWVLATSDEYNADFEHEKEPTPESPSSEFTHVFHYKGGTRDATHRLMDDYRALWRSPSGEVLAAGVSSVVVSVTLSGAAATKLPPAKNARAGAPGPEIQCIWGASSAHVYAAGSSLDEASKIHPIMLERIAAQWQFIDTGIAGEASFHAMVGTTDADVYVAGTELYHYDRRSFTDMRAPTDDGFTVIVALGKRFCATAASSNKLAYGDKSGWRAVPVAVDQIYDLASWRDLVYIATSGGLWSFDGSHAPAFVLKTSTDYVETVSGLSDGLLLSSGEQAWIWDGTSLKAIDSVL
jgi:hypothetical protein